MNDYFNKVVFAAFSTLFLLAFANPVFAQVTEGLQIKPAVVEDRVGPGEAHEYNLTVTNIAAVPKTLYVSAVDIKGVNEQGGPIFSKTGEVTGYELSSWVHIADQVIVLAPQQEKTVTFLVKVPAGASPGSHFAGLFFSDKPTKLETSGSSVGFDVGAIVSLRISGDVHEDAQLREFSTGKLVYPVADVDFHVKVVNSGNVLVQPRGLIEITDMFGKKVGTLSVNDQKASTFPGSDRTYSAQWTSDNFAFGRYQAIASLSYGEEAQKTIYNTTSFWVLPLVPIAIGLGALFAVVLLAYWLMNSYIKRKLRQMGVETTGTAADRMNRKYRKSSSRLMIIAMAVILLCIGLLIAVFFIIA